MTGVLGALACFAAGTIVSFGCDSPSKLNDKTGSRDATSKNATMGNSDDEEDHDHPMYEKQKKPASKKTAKKSDIEDLRAPATPVAAPQTAPAPGPAPSPTPQAPAPTPPSSQAPTNPAPDPAIAARKAMIDAGKLLTSITIEANNPALDATSNVSRWFTSDAKPITCYVAVDAAGAPMVPAGVTVKQIAAGTPAAPTDTKFQANNADVATLHSSCRICNNSGGNLYLHSGNTAAFQHGAAAFANGTCAQFLVERALATPGATYDHVMGNAQNSVVFKIVKVGMDGKIVP